MKTPIWLAVVCLAASLPTHAETFKPIELNDQELASLRGRYVMPGRIISFGIAMTSTWQNANGEVIGATSSMQIQQSTIKPQFYVSMIDEKGTGYVAITGHRHRHWRQRPQHAPKASHKSCVLPATTTRPTTTLISTSARPTRHQPHNTQGQALAAGSTLTGANGAGSMSVSSTGTWRATQHRGQQQPGQYGATPGPGRADAEHDVARRRQPGPQHHIAQCRAA